MQIFTTICDIQAYLQKQNGKIGFLPTMGALHAGHLSLVKSSQEKCDLTVVSIFVNPTQFAPHEDLEKYPRPIEKDKALLEKEKVDVLFLPKIEEIYPQGTKSNLPPLPDFTQVLEGATRPTHFQGVAQVVKRLFEIVKPTDVFFGQKDFQQTLVIKWLIDSFFPLIKMTVCTIVREKSGLALSSRNQYLNATEKKQALLLKHTLALAKELMKKGEKKVEQIEQAMLKNFHKKPFADLDYAVIRDQRNLSQQDCMDENSIALIACKIGKTRLIDNELISSL